MINDLRLAFRQIRRRPAFSASAIVALAIGLATNTLAFSVVNAFLFKPRAGFDVEGAGRVSLTGGNRPGEGGLSAIEFERLAAATAGALDVAVEGRTPLAWNQGTTSETIWALLVSERYFSILETRPLTGRLSANDNAAATPTAVVSERFWRERLQAAEVTTLRLTLNGIDVPVVGVLPEAFEGPGGLYAPQVWVPFEARRTFRLPARLERLDERWLGMIGRLGLDTSVAEVNERLKVVAAALSQEWPRTHRNVTAAFALMQERVPEVQLLARAAAAGMATVGVVLLLACFNVANLLLARAVERQREMGIRAAIGASRWRILRQQIIESLVLATLAGTLATLITIWSQALIGTFAIPMAMPQRVNVAPDLRVMGFAALMVLFAGVLPAIAPALHSMRLNLVRALSAQGHSRSGGRPSIARRALMLLQVAGSTAFLTVAALFVQSFAWTTSADPGFERERALVLAVDASSQGYDADSARLTIDRVIDRLRAMPGVTGAAAATHAPFYIGFPRLTEVAETQAPCASGGCPTIVTYGIGPAFFRTMNIPIVRGREFETASETGVVVNETFARRWFPASDPVGQVVRLGDAGEPRVVIGVTRNTMWRGYAEKPSPLLFVPLMSSDFETTLAIVVQTTDPPAPLVRPVAEAIREVDPNLALESLMTMETRLQFPRWPMESASKFFGACGVLALLLATIGVAALMSHAVGQRTREFGVRLAVGATGGELLRDVIGSALRVVTPGIVLGLVGAALFARGIRIAIVGVDTANPATYVAIALLQGTIALLACMAPARRAANVDPLAALRAE